NNTIEGVTATNRRYGIDIVGGADDRVECSSLLNNNSGLIVEGTSTGIVVTDSYIVGNSVYGVVNSSSSVVDARNNYWGAPNGPRPLGSGDAITANVNVIPFVTRLVDAGPDVTFGAGRTFSSSGSILCSCG